MRLPFAFSCPLWARLGPRGRRILAGAVIVVGGAALLYGVVAVGFPTALRWYTGDKISDYTYPNQDTLTEAQFERLAAEIERDHTQALVAQRAGSHDDPVVLAEKTRLLAGLPSTRREAGLLHVDRFREAGIRTYEGPKTCLQCHEEMTVHTKGGGTETVDLVDDVMSSVHYRLFSSERGAFTTYGYNGQGVNTGALTIPVGKIDRACGIPGSFTWTGWAALVTARPEGRPEETLSEGCGQCHIGGGYGPPSEEMMPVVFREKEAEQGIDCLICHARDYDMNQRYVLDDGVGTRWNQDRSMKAAMSVGRPTQDACLRCHQHNMGGDSYPENEAARHTGYDHARVLHPAAKRGTPYTPEADVHAAAGMTCLDCHVTEGHKIARGRKGVDLVSNDLPDTEVSCVNCHTEAPHVANPEVRAILNGHTARVACETCHITRLWHDNVVLTDWLDPLWDAEEGIYLPRYVRRTGDMAEAVEYLWLNGNGTFLANALGSNPTGAADYNPLMAQLRHYDKSDGLAIAGVEGNDFLSPLSPEMRARRAAMVEKNILPLQELGTSKIYPMKLFNARMYEDMNNQGPFGAMILPFDYPTYYETGDAKASMEKAVSHPMVKRMYQTPFKLYMMDQFMAYFGVGSWTTKYPLDPENEGAIEGHWMRQMGTLMLNHAITKEGRTCQECHTPNGLLDFRALGYDEARAHDLEHLPELQMLKKAGVALPVPAVSADTRELTGSGRMAGGSH